MRDGNPLEECEVYYLTTKNILFWKWDDWKLLDDATVIMQDDITKVQISKKDLTTNGRTSRRGTYALPMKKATKLTAGFLPMHRTTWKSCLLASIL